jgi:hypothetical protein
LDFKKVKGKPLRPKVQLTWFAFCCGTAVISFMYLRTHNVLGTTIIDERPSLRAEFEWWKQLPNVSDKEAKALVVFSRLKSLPPGWAAAKQPAINASAIKSPEAMNSFGKQKYPILARTKRETCVNCVL